MRLDILDKLYELVNSLHAKDEKELKEYTLVLSVKDENNRTYVTRFDFVAAQDSKDQTGLVKVTGVKQ